MNNYADLCENCFEEPAARVFEGTEVCNPCFKQLTKSEKRKSDIAKKKEERAQDFVDRKLR